MPLPRLRVPNLNKTMAYNQQQKDNQIRDENNSLARMYRQNQEQRQADKFSMAQEQHQLKIAGNEKTQLGEFYKHASSAQTPEQYEWAVSQFQRSNPDLYQKLTGGQHEPWEQFQQIQPMLKEQFGGGKKEKPLSAIGKLIAERDSLPEGDPRRSFYDQKLKKEITSKGMVIESDGKGGFTFRTNADQTTPPKEAARDKLYDLELITKTIDSALEKTSFWTTGFAGAVGKKIAGTPAYNLDADVKTIQANLGFDRLQQMREASKTGGALGQVSERELELLVSSRRNLDTAQGKEQVESNLEDIKKYYERWKMSIEGKHPDIYKGDAPQAAIDALTTSPELKDQFFNKYGYLPGAE